MKRLFITALVFAIAGMVFAFSPPADRLPQTLAMGPAGLIVSSGSPPAGDEEVEPFFEADWTSVGATDEICDTTPCPDTWDNLSDTNGGASVSSDQLVFAINSDAHTAYVSLGDDPGEVLNGSSASEFWLEFTIEFSAVTNWETGTNMRAMYITYDGIGAGSANPFAIYTDGSGTVDGFLAGGRTDGGNAWACDEVAWSPSALTEYTFRYHYKAATGAGQNDGIMHGWIVGGPDCEDTAVDNDTFTDPGAILIGPYTCAHDGANNYTITFDSVKYYESDPGW